VADREVADRLQNAWDSISQLTVKRRKQVVLLCRAQEVVSDDEFNLLAIQTDLDVSLPGMEVDGELRRYRSFVHSFHDMITSPILSSIILDMCRSAPLPQSEVDESKLKSWGKEISICESEEGLLHFDYSCWLDPRCFGRPLIAGTPPNPVMAEEIHNALVRWRMWCSQQIFYPRMSRKLVSRDTIRNWEAVFGREWVLSEREGGVEMTQETLERVYHETGIMLEGVSEIRQKWYKAQMAPRTYFSQGGTSYRLSKYIQEIASNLVEQLPTTDPISRLNPARVFLRDESRYLRIYDLSGFTSNHWECKHFVQSVSDWCCGTTITIMDSREGLLNVDLGLTLSTYNQMNQHPAYSLEQVDESFCDLVEYHNRAGFLGVYGNINFSTFLHGSSLLMVCSSTDEANVAGDDAHYSEQDGMEDIADRIILGNGVTEKTKEFRSDQIGAVCLKRGLVQAGERCLPKIMLIFPSFTNLGAIFGYVTLQYGKSDMSKQEKRSMVGAEIFRFLRGVYLSRVREGLDVALEILRAMYELACFPKAGSLPPYGEVLIPVLPETTEEMISISPLESLLRNHFSSGAVLPRIFQNGDDDDSENALLVSGSEWEGTMTKHLKFLEVLGYVVSEELTEVVWGIEAYERLRMMYSGEGRSMYHFVCVSDVPYHLII